MGTLEKKGLENVEARVLISERAQICFDLHVVVDGLEEGGREDGAEKGRVIGTTKKGRVISLYFRGSSFLTVSGIGPCYSDAIARRGVPMWMLFSGEDENGVGEWERRLRQLEGSYKRLFAGGLGLYSVEEEIARFKSYRERLKPLIVSPTPLLSSKTSEGSGCNVLVEVALVEGMGRFSPISDHCLAPELKCLVPFLRNSPIQRRETPYRRLAENLERRPAESAGLIRVLHLSNRPLMLMLFRCGWLDLVVVKYSSEVNGYTAINLTKLDILDSFSEIKVATAYSLVSHDDTEIEKLSTFPADLEVLQGSSRKGKLHVEYQTFEGWQTRTTGCQRWEDLPKLARSYVEFIERYVEVPITHIGTGPKREDMIER
ncbi:MAG: hypothetical protein Q9195_002252 [Heterodermia aff. obscurata]